jgi:hypothetical protein
VAARSRGYWPLGGGGLSGGASAGGVSAGGGASVGEVEAGGVSAGGGVFAGVLGVPGVVAVSVALSVLVSSRGPQALRSATAAHSGIHDFMLIGAP